MFFKWNAWNTYVPFIICIFISMPCNVIYWCFGFRTHNIFNEYRILSPLYVKISCSWCSGFSYFKRLSVIIALMINIISFSTNLSPSKEKNIILYIFGENLSLTNLLYVIKPIWSLWISSLLLQSIYIKFREFVCDVVSSTENM